MISYFTFTINTMFFTLLFGYKWIIALFICTEIVCHGELHYSKFGFLQFFFSLVLERNAERIKQDSLLNLKAALLPVIQTASFVAPFRTYYSPKKSDLIWEAKHSGGHMRPTWQKHNFKSGR